MAIHVSFRVNGDAYSVDVPSGATLAEVLRYHLGLTGTKVACNVGVCGVCTVLLDGEMVSSCLVLAAMADGKDVTTVEGLAAGEELSPLQRAFVENGGFQCGICTPGQIMAATALLNEHPHPSDGEIKEWMSGNLCRCTGYYQIAQAIRAAAAAS